MPFDEYHARRKTVSSPWRAWRFRPLARMPARSSFSSPTSFPAGCSKSHRSGFSNIANTFVDAFVSARHGSMEPRDENQSCPCRRRPNGSAWNFPTAAPCCRRSKVRVAGKISGDRRQERTSSASTPSWPRQMPCCATRIASKSTGLIADPRSPCKQQAAEGKVMKKGRATSAAGGELP